MKHMKNFLRPLKLVCLAAASMLIVSCGSGADYRSILPADSFMTVSVNPASLMRKCEAGDLDQHPLYVRIKAELDKDQNLSAEEKEYLLALLKNPGESGIDVKKDFFFFAAMEGTVDAPVMRGGLLLPIGDKAKFDALLARINEKSGVAPETKGGVSVVDLGKEGDAGVLCAYNDIAFMVYFVQNGVDDLAGDVRKLFAQQSGESLMDDKAVAEQLARKNDINMVLSYGEILPMMNNPMLSSSCPTRGRPRLCRSVSGILSGLLASVWGGRRLPCSVPWVRILPMSGICHRLCALGRASCHRSSGW